MKRNTVIHASVTAFLTATAAEKSMAQTLPPPTVPNAGSILQQRNAESSRSDLPNNAGKPVLPQAVLLAKRYRIAQVEFVGNQKIGHEELDRLLQPYIGKEVSRQDLEEIANEISAIYREHGLGFTFTSVSPEGLEQGAVKFVIIEGRAGKVSLRNHTRVRNALLEGMLTKFRDNPDNTNELDRATLLMSAVPGVIAAQPRLSRGEDNGTVDVEVEVQPAPLVTGSVSLDNYGSRTSGRTRLSAMLGLNNPFGWGDALRLNVSGFPFKQSGDSTFGGLTYDFPIGNHGLRGGVGFNRMQYHLGDAYEGQFDGTANVWAAYLSYPIVRGQTHNLFVKIGYNHSKYKDNQVGFENQRTTDAVSASLSGNWQDKMFTREADTQFSATLTHGNLRYDNELFAAQDATGSKTAGGYSKVEMYVSRTQPLSNSTYIQASVQGQYAFKNLDGSARLVFGGPFGVRAYSSDFVSVDSGVLIKSAIGWRLPVAVPVSVSAFYETATGVMRHDPFAGQRNNANVQGAGVAIDTAYKSVSASLSFATRVGGHAPGIESQPKSWVWMSVAYNF